jgi:hypothetical protein
MNERDTGLAETVRHIAAILAAAYSRSLIDLFRAGGTVCVPQSYRIPVL